MKDYIKKSILRYNIRVESVFNVLERIKYTMDFKINSGNGIRSSFTGPSQSYHQAQERFREILETKLNVILPDSNQINTANQSFNDSSIDMLLNNTPRNLLDEYGIGSLPASNNPYASAGKIAINGVLDSSNVRARSNVSASYIDSKLAGTPMAGLGRDFKEAEEKYGINALFLTGLAIHESNFGRSNIARDKNNLFGFQAYDSSPYSSARTFSSMGESIDHVARYLSRNYLTPEGRHFNGYSISAIGKRYATDPLWANKIEKRISSLIGL